MIVEVEFFDVEIARALFEAWTQGLRRSVVQEAIPQNKLLVAKVGPAPVGFALYDDREVRIHYMVTHPKHRREKIATKLFDQIYIDAGLRRITAIPTTAEAKKLLTSLGFHGEGLNTRWERGS